MRGLISSHQYLRLYLMDHNYEICLEGWETCYTLGFQYLKLMSHLNLSHLWRPLWPYTDVTPNEKGIHEKTFFLLPFLSLVLKGKCYAGCLNKLFQLIFDKKVSFLLAEFRITGTPRLQIQKCHKTLVIYPFYLIQSDRKGLSQQYWQFWHKNCRDHKLLGLTSRYFEKAQCYNQGGSMLLFCILPQWDEKSLFFK